MILIFSLLTCVVADIAFWYHFKGIIYKFSLLGNLHLIFIFPLILNWNECSDKTLFKNGNVTYSVVLNVATTATAESLNLQAINIAVEFVIVV